MFYSMFSHPNTMWDAELFNNLHTSWKFNYYTCMTIFPVCNSCTLNNKVMNRNPHWSLLLQWHEHLSVPISIKTSQSVVWIESHPICNEKAKHRLPMNEYANGSSGRISIIPHFAQWHDNWYETIASCTQGYTILFLISSICRFVFNYMIHFYYWYNKGIYTQVTHVLNRVFWLQ